MDQRRRKLAQSPTLHQRRAIVEAMTAKRRRSRITGKPSGAQKTRLLSNSSGKVYLEDKELSGQDKYQLQNEKKEALKRVAA